MSASLLALTVAAGVAVATEPTLRWTGPIREAAARFGVPEPWIRRVMRVESAGRTQLGGRPIVSRAGAMGLMQLMPGTWQEMRVRHGLGTNPHEPRDNILAGAAYLRLMYDRFGYPGLFAAYNAGPARYQTHLATGRALPRETLAYVASVAGTSQRPWNRRVPEMTLSAMAPLHAVVEGSPQLSAAAATTSTLFVRLRGTTGPQSGEP